MSKTKAKNVLKAMILGGNAVKAIETRGLSPSEAAAEFGQGIKLNANASVTDPVQLFARKVDQVIAYEEPADSPFKLPRLAETQAKFAEVFADIDRPVSQTSASKSDAEFAAAKAELAELAEFLS